MINKKIVLLLVAFIGMTYVNFSNINSNDILNVKTNSLKINTSTKQEIKLNSNYIEDKSISGDEAYEDLLIVNKKHGLDKNYIPNDLVIPNLYYDNPNNKMSEPVKKDVAEAIEQMFNDAKSDGITLIGVSGYRDYNYQKDIYENTIEGGN